MKDVEAHLGRILRRPIERYTAGVRLACPTSVRCLRRHEGCLPIRAGFSGGHKGPPYMGRDRRNGLGCASEVLAYEVFGYLGMLAARESVATRCPDSVRWLRRHEAARFHTKTNGNDVIAATRGLCGGLRYIPRWRPTAGLFGRPQGPPLHGP